MAQRASTPSRAPSLGAPLGSCAGLSSVPLSPHHLHAAPCMLGIFSMNTSTSPESSSIAPPSTAAISAIEATCAVGRTLGRRGAKLCHPRFSIACFKYNAFHDPESGTRSPFPLIPFAQLRMLCNQSDRFSSTLLRFSLVSCAASPLSRCLLHAAPAVLLAHGVHAGHLLDKHHAVITPTRLIVAETGLPLLACTGPNPS